MNRLFRVLMILAAVLLISPGVSAQKRSSAARSKTASAVPKCAWINFENSAEVWQLAADQTNVYVALAWTKHLVVINKKTGNMSKIEADGDVQAVVTAGGKCYYFVVTKGLYSYDAATGASRGPLFGLKPGMDTLTQYRMAASPDGNYILCCGQLINVLTGAVSKATSGSSIALNNAGGAYIGTPEACFCPSGQSAAYIISNRVVVESIFADPVTGNAYFACEQGLGYSTEFPGENAGLTRVKSLSAERIYAVNRDDAGNFIFALNGGIAIGGKDIDAPLTMYKPLKTGIKSGYSDITVSYDSARLIAPDKSGNILVGCPYSGGLLIFNPNGLTGYTSIRGKAANI